MIRINLLPEERERRPRFRLPRLSTFALLLLLLVLLGTWWTYLTVRNSRLEAEVRRLDEEIALLRPKVQQVEALRSRIEQARRREALLRRLEQAVFPWDHVLEEVRALTPKDVWLTNLASDERGNVTIGGFGLSYAAVARFIANLEASPSFHEVDLGGSQKQQIAGRSVVNFTLTCRLATFQASKEASGQ
ncbi:MAG: PilN domain-containing protein [Armatimonadota bacterium]|nr:PilN domain-containing protein [Armatimonadota bacterium]MDR5704041.1 PilN domain-containing protein [Armatimonadota bacterium]MDR7435558.1 PilN domain-containing protein [Armatimonadota bacterium]